MMLPPCYIRNSGNTDMLGKTVIKNLRKDIMKEFPLSSLYVEDELLRGADRHIWDFLINDKNDLGPYIKKEIYNDNKKNEILKYIGLSGEDEEGVNSNAEFNSDVTSDSESLSTVSKDEKVSVSEEKESSPISYILDNNSDNYVRVLKSKINNPKNQPENKILYECLERLFNYLLSGFEDIKLMPSIGKDTSKELFIYRFSGIRKNDQDINTDEKILWTGSGVLLGYIARCLFSSSTNPPMGITKFASFFKQESGKQFNLPASAKCEKIENKDDYETKRRIKQIHEEFVMAVELLRKCGFINAEYTSRRRETLQYRKKNGRTQN